MKVNELRNELRWMMNRFGNARMVDVIAMLKLIAEMGEKLQKRG